MPSTQRRRQAPLLFSTVVLLLILAAFPLGTAAESANPFEALTPRDPVAVAWQRAQSSGAYHFTTTIIETTAPAPALANVGQGSRQQRLYLEGDTDLPARGLQMVLWQDGGTVMDARDGIEVQISGDDAYGRPIGGTWQPIDDFSGAFAPGNDLMAYLAGARNVEETEEGGVRSKEYEVNDDLADGAYSLLPASYSVYAFDLNGPELARYMRDQLETQLRKDGELPPGVTLSVSDQFRDTIGGGQVWVDADGLPMRLVVDIAYPQQEDGERVSTRVVTDFSGYDRQALAATEKPLGRLTKALHMPATRADWSALRQQAGFAAGTLGLLALVIVNRRSRVITGAFTITMVVAMVITPLLQSAHVAAFNDQAAAEQAAFTARREEQEEAAEANAALASSDWDAHAGTGANRSREYGVGSMSTAAEAAANQRNSAYSLLPTSYSSPPASTSSSAISYALLASDATPEPDSDDDGDGLTYAQEERLGTDPDEADTDGDQITDDVEVAGYRFAGQTWYTDPLSADTNNDGQLDSVECPTQARESENALSPAGQSCQDTDGDGTPDVADRDNDGDGVPDRVDLSPYSELGALDESFDDDNPLLMQVDDLEADRPVFVDVQLRPEDPDHLWYAFNVLDWPSGDEEGQIQRRAGNDSTWASVADEGEEVSANADNGDMRLIPMLEIEIPYKEGHYGNLPVKEGAPELRTADLELDDWLDTSKLTPYGIAVRPKNDDGDLLAYVPLNLVQDETGGDRVAFAARMHYWPTSPGEGETTSDWGLTQQMRVVWMVHMLTDYRDEDNEWVLDVPQVVRAYPESWMLTGLAVREDHGLDVAITYEDPGQDEDLQYDDPLWGVARGLEASFAVGRDQDDDGTRDLTIVDIDTRFSLTSTSTITARFGISPEIGLETQTYSYDHEDFVTHVMMTETKDILAGFSGYVDQGADAVTLLFAQESSARTGNLDGDDDMVMVDGARLTLRLSQDSAPVEVATYLNWGPFRYDDSSRDWESYPIAEYLDNLEVRLKEVLDEYADEDNYDDILAGQITVAKAYYIALFHGYRNLVEMGPDLTGPQDPAQTDEALAGWLQGDPIEQSGGLISRQITALTRGFYRAGIGAKLFYTHKKADDLFASIGGWVKEKKGNVANGWGNLGKLKKSLAIGVGVLAVAAVVTLLVTAAVFFEGGEALVYIINGLSIVMSTVDVVAIGFNVVKRGTQTVTQALKNLKVLKLSAKAGSIAFAVAVAIIWGVFIYQVVQGGAKPGSLAFNSALATTIASTITAGILLAITAIPIVGQIIAALIFLIDAITMFVCTTSDSDHWYCDYGISGLITAGIKWIIYSASVMVDVENENRLDITTFEQDFVDPDKGLSVGNSLAFKVDVENEIELIEWKDTNYDWKAGAYWWQYSDKTLRSSTFDYALQDNTASIHSGLDRGDIRSDWDSAGDDRVRLVASAETDVALNQAGINQDVDLYLIEGYALPVQECWAFPIIIPFPPIYIMVPVCTVRTTRGSGDIDLGKDLYYDVFPETLDEFTSLTTVDGGYALDWSQDTDLAFPRLTDADGDGLRVYRDEGADPDDGDWDSDDDGLSDFFEHEQGTDPTDADSDDDGLTDREEVILGTSPLRTDTDYDGLTDREEVEGWEFVYDFADDGSQISTWVTADPLAHDPDLDTLTDFQEKTFGFHPQVPSDPHVLSLSSEVRESNAPRLLLRFSETAGAAAFGDDSGYMNNGRCEGAACPVAGHEGRYGNAPHFDGTSDYISADSICTTLADEAGTSGYSMGVWFMAEGGMSEDAILLAFNTAGGDNVLHLGFDSGDNHVYLSASGQRTESGAVALNQWHHAAVTVEADGTARLYVNGAQVGSIPTTATPESDGRFSIGQEWDGDTPGNFFLGRIDEVLVFSHALSQDEVTALQAGRYNPEDRTVRPTDTLDYEARVKNQLYNRYAQGLLSTHFPVGFGEIAPEDFILNPQEGTVVTGTLAVAGSAASGTYSLTQEVDALITDWREASNYADLLYHFAESSPPFEDSSGSQPPREGDCSGGACPTTTTGRYGNGLVFDGTGDYVTNDNVARYLTGDAFSFGAWVNPAGSMTDDGTLLAFNTDSGGNRNTLMYNAGNSRFFYRDNKTDRVYSALPPYNADTWHHVMVVVEADDTATLYVNGQAAATFETSVRPDPDGSFNVGQEYDGATPSEFFKGTLDEVVVYNRALTADEVRDAYSDPVLYLPLDEEFGARTFDDAAPFDEDARCRGDACPQSGVAGIVGRAATFDSADYLNVPENAAFALDDGEATLSAWVYPEGEGTVSDCPFVAEYFGNTSLATNEYTMRQCENYPIDHNWYESAAFRSESGQSFYNNFSVRWTGTFFFAGGDHTFTFGHDDGMRVWLDDDLLLDNWTDGSTTDQDTRNVSAGLHTVKVETYEHNGNARAQVSWTPAPLPQPQGILGAQADSGGDDYPSIQRVGDRVRVVLNDDTAFLSPAGVLSENAWHHVAATFDGTTLTAYVDGVDVGQLAASGQTPFDGTGLDIGRTARSGELRLDKVSMIETADTNSGGDLADELLLDVQLDGGAWQAVPISGEFYEGDEETLSYSTRFAEEATLRMTESDDGEYELCYLGNCDGEGPEDEPMGSTQIALSDPSPYEIVTRFESDTGRYDDDIANLRWYAEVDSVPFEGRIDEVKVYRQAFSAEEVEDLYTAGTQVLRLPLDDAPGSTEFDNDLGDAVGTCDGDGCPTAGLQGRDGWALSFDGVDDVVTIDEANTETLDELTIAAWVKPDALPAGEIMRFVSLADEKAVLRYDGASGSEQLHFYMTIQGSFHSLRVDGALETDTWTHVTGTYDGTTMRLYKNGQEIADASISGELGEGNAVQLSHVTETLDGMLDDVVVMRHALSESEIAALANEAPQLMLTLDEASATEQFADGSGNGNTGTCVGTDCPTAGAKGQLGLAADFDGARDIISIDHDDSLMPDDAMTLVAWVRAVDPDVDQKIAGKSNTHNGYVLGLDNGQLYPEIWDSTGTRYSDRWGHINPNTWTFVAVTYESGGEMIGYINGEVAGRTTVGSQPISSNSRPLIVGAAPWNTASYRVNGRIDHVLLYNRALSESEMRAMFRLQAKWVEERESTEITVDADDPVSTLVSDDVYRPNADVMLLATAEDDTTPVTMMEMGVSYAGGPTTWTSAPRCADAATAVLGDTAWCPLFEPTGGEGRYELQMRATDNVGNREVPASTAEFLIDDTPPVPATDIQDGDLIQASPRPNASWLVPLSGTVTDPQIAGTTSPGSGTSDVQVQLTATAHPTDTQVPRTATLVGNTWTVQYPLPYADATGTYTMAVQATDNVGNVSEVISLVSLGLDTTAPVATLDHANTMTVPITSTLTLAGPVTGTGVLSAGIDSVRVGFTPMAQVAVSGTVAIFHLDDAPTSMAFAATGGTAVGAGTATCEAGSCPDAGAAGVWGTALDFGGAAYVTADFVSSAISETDGFSFGAWVNPASTSGARAILAFNTGTGGNRNFIKQDNHKLCYDDGAIAEQCSENVISGVRAWHHVLVAITEEGQGTLYLDGAAVRTFETSMRPDPAGRFSIGQEWDNDTPSQYFNGTIDEVLVLDRALTPEEVVTLVQDGSLDASGDGVTQATWQLDVPTGLDGLYTINLRPSDVMSNTPGSDWQVWNGEIDTQAPRVEMEVEEEVSYLSMKTHYTCRARDFNLVWVNPDSPGDNFQCVCDTLAPMATVVTPTFYHEASPWYADTFTDTNRLYSLEASCTVLGPAIDGAQARACDRYGRCDHATGEPSQIGVLRATDSAVVTPTLNSVITSTQPMTIETEAYAASYLKSYRLWVDNSIIDTVSWPTEVLTQTTLSTAWVPTKGTHILKSQVQGHNGDWQLIDHPVTVLVDVTPPGITINPLVLTTTHRLSQDRVALTGHADDTNGVSKVEVRTDDGETQTAWETASLYGNDWQLDWHLGEEPEDKVYTVTARAIDFAEHTTWVTETVLVNLATPNPITLTLTNAGDVVTPGLTLRGSNKNLTLTWVTETQRADLQPYEVRWTTYRAAGVTTPSSVAPATGPLTATHTAAEASRVRPQVISRLTTGATQSDVYGTITIDGPNTPDYISLETVPGEWRPYLGWMESGCTLLGVDRRIADNAPGSAAVDDAQRFYASWDSQALRLAWTGANWDYAGDLFIYLDTTVGGAVAALDPFADPHDTEIMFPGDLGFGADALIWVEDSSTAHFLIPDDPELGTWTTRSLGPDEFRFEAGLNDGHTDLYLTFDTLGITNPTLNPLAMVAFATEEDTMSLWATMPPANPADSARVAETGVYAPEDATIALTQLTIFPSLRPGLCPSDGYGDVDLDITVSVEPAGAAYSMLGSDLFWLSDLLANGTPPADLSTSFEFMDVNHPLLGDGDPITYTLHYANHGTDTAENVKVVATGLSALRFSGLVTHTIVLGDVAPDATGTVTFTGAVDRDAAVAEAYEPCLTTGSELTCTQYLNWAVLKAFVTDEQHDLTIPLDLLWASHQVDGDPPEFFGFEQPERFINPGLNLLGGYAYDPSGVPTLTLTLNSHTTTCTDPTPDDGTWSCAWNATVANGGLPADGDAVTLDLQAMDGHGNESGNPAPTRLGSMTRLGSSDAPPSVRTFVVDAGLPEISFDATTTDTYSGTVVGESTFTFSGVVTDAHGIGSVEVCLNGDCGPASLETQGTATQVLTDVAASPMTIPACGVDEVARTFTVADSMALGDVQIGINADHTRRNDISATLTSPAGTVVQVLGPYPGSPYDAENYDVLLSDGAEAALHAVRTDDSTAAPFYDREARPDDPLRSFIGEDAAGTWTLKLCDTMPLTKTGTYSHSRLILSPVNTAATSGTWSFSTGNPEAVDGEIQQVTATAVDLAGNRSAAVALSFELDNVPPAVALQAPVELIELAPERGATEVLSGTASDGGRLVRVYAMVESPSGDLRSRQVSRDGGDWWFELNPEEPGAHRVWINAMDEAENTTTADQRTTTVVQLTATADSPTTAGASTTLTATLRGDTGYSFTWDFGDSSGAGTGAIVSHSYTAAGTYTPTVTATKGTESFVITTTVSVEVQPTAVDALEDLMILSDSPTVLGETTTLTASTSAMVFDDDLGWNLGDGTATTGRVIQHVYAMTGTYTVTLSASDDLSTKTVSRTVRVVDQAETPPDVRLYLPLIVAEP